MPTTNGGTARQGGYELAYIFKINPNKQQLYMSNSEVNIAFELQASKEALKQLKALIESEEGKL